MPVSVISHQKKAAAFEALSFAQKALQQRASIH